MIAELLNFAEMIFIAMALPLAVIAALGFKGSPFGKLVVPLPFILVLFLVADGSLLLVGRPHPTIYYAVAGVGVLTAVYAAYHGMMILTERRSV